MDTPAAGDRVTMKSNPMISPWWAKVWPYALSLSLHGAVVGTGAAIHFGGRLAADSIAVIQVRLVAVTPSVKGAVGASPGAAPEDNAGAVATPPMAAEPNRREPPEEQTALPRDNAPQRARNHVAREGALAVDTASPAPAPFETGLPPLLRGADRSAEQSLAQGSGGHPNSPADRPSTDGAEAGERVQPGNTGVAFPPTAEDTGALVASVRDGIDAVKRYPRMARQAGQQGRALIKFRLLRSGEVADPRVIDSSGFPILDDAALAAVERAAPFVEQGRRIGSASIEIVLPIVFRLR
jgi:protein TonB